MSIRNPVQLLAVVLYRRSGCLLIALESKKRDSKMPLKNVRHSTMYTVAKRGSFTSDVYTTPLKHKRFINKVSLLGYRHRSTIMTIANYYYTVNFIT